MIVVIIIFVLMVLLGAFNLSYQIYKMIELDAKCRGLKHPKFWGLFSISGNNGTSGLLLYLFGRKKYPITISTYEKNIINSRKKKSLASLLFIAIATIGLVIITLFYN